MKVSDKISSVRFKAGCVLGTFSKGNDHSVSVNFGVSGGRHCDTSCSHHPESTAEDAPKNCYAVKGEKRGDRALLRAKLARHDRMAPARVIGKALLELQDLVNRGKRVEWVRISTNGSVPQWDTPGCSALFKTQFMTFLRYCKANNILVHFPVETKEKADRYRELLGDLAVVRESVQCPTAFVLADGAVSSSAGAGLPLLDRVELCRGIAHERVCATGRKTIVCPAVVSGFKLKVESDSGKRELRIANAGKAKCGNCTACAQPHIDVIYPAH